MRTAEKKIQLISHNLTNTQTPGFEGSPLEQTANSSGGSHASANKQE